MYSRAEHRESAKPRLSSLRKWEPAWCWWRAILNAPRGMPVLTGISAYADKAALNEWSLSMAAAVRIGENLAAKSFLPIAKSCN